MSEDTHNIDLAECERRLIKVVKLPTVSTETIRDLTVVVLATATVDWMDGTYSTTTSNKNNSSTSNTTTTTTSKMEIEIVLEIKYTPF